jgi:hypothetical protein
VGERKSINLTIVPAELADLKLYVGTVRVQLTFLEDSILYFIVPNDTLFAKVRLYHKETPIQVKPTHWRVLKRPENLPSEMSFGFYPKSGYPAERIIIETHSLTSDDSIIRVLVGSSEVPIDSSETVTSQPFNRRLFIHYPSDLSATRAISIICSNKHFNMGDFKILPFTGRFLEGRTLVQMSIRAYALNVRSSQEWDIDTGIVRGQLSKLSFQMSSRLFKDRVQWKGDSLIIDFKHTVGPAHETFNLRLLPHEGRNSISGSIFMQFEENGITRRVKLNVAEMKWEDGGGLYFFRAEDQLVTYQVPAMEYEQIESGYRERVEEYFGGGDDTSVELYFHVNK